MRVSEHASVSKETEYGAFCMYIQMAKGSARRIREYKQECQKRPSIGVKETFYWGEKKKLERRDMRVSERATSLHRDK
jgi:hypothetical protein